MSDAPTKNSAISETTSVCETPNTIVAAPKIATHTNISTPERRRIGRTVKVSEISIAPNAGAARSMPSPRAPVCSTSCA